MKELKRNTDERNRVLNDHINTQKEKLKELKRELRKWERMKEEEQERQASLNLDQRIEQFRERQRTIREGLTIGRERLQGLLPLLLLINQTNGNRTNPGAEALLNEALMIMGQFTQAENVRTSLTCNPRSSQMREQDRAMSYRVKITTKSRRSLGERI